MFGSLTRRLVARRVLGALLVALLAAACGPVPGPAPTPTLEPVLPSLTPTLASPTEVPPATPTPVPLDQGQQPGDQGQQPGAGDILPTPPPLVAETTAECLGAPNGIPRLPDLRYGVNVAYGTPPAPETLALARDMGAGWVRAVLPWSAIEPQQRGYRWEPVDALARAAQASGLRVLLAIDSSPAWASASGHGGLPDRPEDLAEFMEALASHAGEAIDAYEIWPAPNLATAYGGAPVDPAHYAAVLSAGYTAIKQANPCALVLNGGLVPNASRDRSVALDDLAFYREMLASGARDAFDILAVQLNTSGEDRKGDWPGESPALSRGFYGHVGVIRDEMIFADQGDRQIWVVRSGYQLDGEFAVSPEQQAEYLVEMYDWSRNTYPWISGIFARDLLTGPQPDGDFSLLNRDGSPRPAYEALKSYFMSRKADREQVVPVKGTDLVLLWWQSQVREPAGEIVEGPQGGVFVPSEIGYIRVFDANGAYRMAPKPAGKDILGVAVGADGTLYASTHNSVLVAYTAGGAPSWSALIEGVPATRLLLSRDGSALYTGTDRERLEAYATTGGAKLWEVPLGGMPGQPARGADGTIYVGATSNTLRAIAPDGSQRWEFATDGWVRVAPAATAATIYAASEAGTLFALNLDGSERWRVDLGAAPAGLVAGDDDSVYSSTLDGRLIAYGSDRSQRWELALDGTRLTAPARSADGRLYVGGEDGVLRVITPDGAVQGSFGFNSPIQLPPLAGRGGAVYVALAEGDNALVAFGPQELRERYFIP